MSVGGIIFMSKIKEFIIKDKDNNSIIDIVSAKKAISLLEAGLACQDKQNRNILWLKIGNEIADRHERARAVVRRNSNDNITNMRRNQEGKFIGNIDNLTEVNNYDEDDNETWKT
jgi:hypothetical protein